jgi:hypothetical protein
MLVPFRPNAGLVFEKVPQPALQAFPVGLFALHYAAVVPTPRCQRVPSESVKGIVKGIHAAAGKSRYG